MSIFFFILLPLFSIVSLLASFNVPRLPRIFLDLRPVEITFSTPFPPSTRKLICRNAEETLVCLVFNPFEWRNVTNEQV